MNSSAEKRLLSDVFGGLASMLVAFPSAVAFGLIVFAPLGTELKGIGAIAGMLGAIALGIVAPFFGGAPRLVTAPCAPAAAVLAAYVAQQGLAHPESAVILVTLIAMLAGILQLAFGLAGGGRLIKYIPYPVVAGYLSGVGCLIILSQVPKFLGLPKDTSLFQGLINPGMWNIQGVYVGLVTVLGMILALRLTRAVPAPIIALGSGIAAYFSLTVFYPELTSLAGNPLVIGDLGTTGFAAIGTAFSSRWISLQSLTTESLLTIIVPALTLSILLAIDTLKTCVVVDALTRSRHNSNRELVAQGLGNVASSLVGGLPGAGTMGATLVNISSGGHSRFSGMLEGVFSAAAFLIFGSFVAWIPVPALAGILLVVAFKMIDRNSFHLLKQRTTIVDFLVIAAVVATAIAFNLIAAAGVGLGLAILLFMRDQIRSSVVRRQATGAQLRSKRQRLPDEQSILEKHGGTTAIFELQGALFFGTTDRLSIEIEPHLSSAKYIILDMRRIQAVDFTAAHMLELLENRISERGGNLIFSQIPRNLPTGQNLRLYFDQVGLVRPTSSIKMFPDLDSALEWTEDQILSSHSGVRVEDDTALSLKDMALFRELDPESVALLTGCTSIRTISPGQRLFKAGDVGDEIFFIRSGDVRIELPLTGGHAHHIATFGPGNFLGDMSFLDDGTRSADAVAKSQVSVYVLSRQHLDHIAGEHPKIAGAFFAALARILAIRLRHTDSEVRALAET